MIIGEEKFLRGKSEDVKPEEVEGLIKLLEKGLSYSALLGKPGIGLAAPQIGIKKRAAIVRINTGANSLSVNLVNARIEKAYNSFVFKDEGCLSFDGKLYDTTRYQEIYVINNAVAPHSFIATGLMAVAIQHELDHLDGVLFFDRIANKITSKIKIRPNDPCSCGQVDQITGKVKKYKRCCGVK